MEQSPGISSDGLTKWRDRLDDAKSKIEWLLGEPKTSRFFETIRLRLWDTWADLERMARAYDGTRALFLAENIQVKINATGLDDGRMTRSALLDIAAANPGDEREQARMRKISYVLAARLELECETLGAKWTVHLSKVSPTIPWRIFLVTPGGTDKELEEAGRILVAACKSLGIEDSPVTPGLLVIMCERER